MDWQDILQRFDQGYVVDFQRCWDTSGFLREPDGPASPEAVTRLAVALDDAMTSWGAGKRRAPSMVSLADVEGIVVSTRLQQLVSHVARWFCSGTWEAGRYPTLEYFELLRLASDQLLKGNTNVNYASKICLLFAGAGPAFDSRVRRGLTERGLRGWSALQHKMPATLGDPVARRMRAVHLWGARLLREHKSEIEAAAADNPVIRWHVENGAWFRLLDIMCFVEGKQDTTARGDVRASRATAPATAQREAGMIERATWAERSRFRYRTNADGSVDIAFGSGPTRRRLTRQKLDDLLAQFGGQSVKPGTSRTNPPEGSLGEWLIANFTKVATASYIAPVLIDLGHAARDGGELRFRVREAEGG